MSPVKKTTKKAKKSRPKPVSRKSSNGETNESQKTQGPASPQKIGVFGLDNAGKTTIVRVIQGENNLDTLANLQPTSHVQIQNLQVPSVEWVLWDFGGQENYREEYTAAPERYFDGLNLLIFVIDVQDMERAELALEYFSKCLDYVTQFRNPGEMQLLVLLHKVDPDLLENPRVQVHLQFLRDQVALIAKQHEISASIRSSTIFDEKLQLQSEISGTVDVEQNSNNNTYGEMIAAAKNFHRRLRQLKDQGASDSVADRDESTENIALDEKKMKQKNTESIETLKMLSLERKRIIEEFKAMLSH
ncbi:MAG TPA: ADP-ribosylation factor-like protein [Candidatus Lokiarchaeia archaeon]|nr:ADP-ribosylation factor-like protein [Candidatus Lokiarchaeia archaeon]